VKNGQYLPYLSKQGDESMHSMLNPIHLDIFSTYNVIWQNVRISQVYRETDFAFVSIFYVANENLSIREATIYIGNGDSRVAIIQAHTSNEDALPESTVFAFACAKRLLK
jgi:hypothetical protein